MERFKPFSIVGILFSIAGIATIIQKLYKWESNWLLQTLRQGYESVTSRIFSVFIDWWFPGLIEGISNVLGWKVELFPNWRDMMALLMLYLAVHVKAAFLDNVPRPLVAFSLRAVAAAIVLMAAIGLGSGLHANGVPQIAVIYLACILGIGIYRIGFAAQFALDHWDKGRFPAIILREGRGVYRNSPWRHNYARYSSMAKEKLEI